MAGKKESTKPVNGGSTTTVTTVRTTTTTTRTTKSSGGRSSGSGGRSGGSGGGAGGILQTIVRWLSLAIAVIEIAAIICFIVDQKEEVRAYFVHIFFIFGSLMVILSMAGVTGAFIGTRFGFAGDCCWPVGLYLIWQAGCLFSECFGDGCGSAHRAGAILNIIAFSFAWVDFILGLVARFI